MHNLISQMKVHSYVHPQNFTYYQQLQLFSWICTIRNEWQLYICNLFTYKSPKTEAKAILSAAYLPHKCLIHCHHRCNCAKRLQGYILCWRNNTILTVINHIKRLVSLKQRKKKSLHCIPVALNMLLNLIFYWPSCLLNNQLSFNFHLTDLLSEIDES